MSEDYWDGANWVFEADITNDGSNSGNHVYTITVGAGNELEILYGNILNGDTSARTASAVIDDGSTTTAFMESLSLGAGAQAGFPHANAAGTIETGPTRFIVAGTMRIVVTVASVATSQDTALAIACRIRGGIPTVVLTSPTDAVEVVNTNRVF